MRKKQTIRRLIFKYPHLDLDVVNTVVSAYEASFKRMVNGSVEELNVTVPELGRFKFHGNSKNKFHKIFTRNTNKRNRLKELFSDRKLLF
jgi:hypothetical protein